MGNGRSAGHDVGVKAIVGISWQLEEARRPLDQRIEALSRSIVGEARAINVPREGDDRLQLPAKLERKFGGDLVGAISDRRDEAELGRPRREAIVLAFEQCPPESSSSFRISRMRCRKRSTSPSASTSARWPVTPTERTKGIAGGPARIGPFSTVAAAAMTGAFTDLTYFAAAQTIITNDR